MKNTQCLSGTKCIMTIVALAILGSCGLTGITLALKGKLAWKAHPQNGIELSVDGQTHSSTDTEQKKLNSQHEGGEK